MTSPEARFTALVDRTRQPLLAYAVRRVAEPADAADVVAETYLVAWRRLADVPPGEEAVLWLFGVARKVLANHYRGERRRHALADRLRESLPAVVPPPQVDEVSLVTEALTALRPADQEILRLVAWEGLAPEEIAVVLGVSGGTARVRLHRARSRLAAELARRSETDDVGVQRHSRSGQVVGGRATARPDAQEMR